MILSGGPPDAVSFTDDTSLDQRLTGSRVSIHCQVLPERSLDWYYTLLWRAPSRQGEIKSSDVIQTFLALPTPARVRLLGTLRFVRVNITDPRPYVSSYDDLLARIIPGVTAADFLARLAQAEERVARTLQRASRELVVGQMIRDSPAERLKQQHRALTRWSSFWMMDGDHNQMEEPDFDFRPFENARARINLSSVSAFVSKSGSVFNPALDELHQATQVLRGPPTAGDFWGVQRALDDLHVFDDGNRKAIEWIDKLRTEAICATDPYVQFGAGRKRKPLESIDSRDSVFIQAADIAAGIATALWNRGTLMSVVRTFDHVTYNGKRIGETDADRITHDLSRYKPNAEFRTILAP